MKPKVRFTAIFFKDPVTGTQPVKEWLAGLPKTEKKKVGQDLMFLQFNWPVGMPRARHLRKELWEQRTSLNKRIARVLFVIQQKNIILLNGFIKKTQQTPPEEIELAFKRLKLME
ncbi:hypothetical protein BH09DEP1_BH09DEP1_2120 [soil metagenome]